MVGIGAYIICCFAFSLTHAIPDIGLSRDEKETAQNYMLRYGYMDKFSTSNDDLIVGLTRLQSFAGIDVTGKFDAATVKLMSTPRCGLADPKISIKVKRYVHQGTKWIDKKLLTWRLANRGRTLERDTIRDVMYKAFNLWSAQTDLNFKEVSTDDPDIWVRFVTGWHDDPYAFDGPGGTLAHAFYPHNNRGLSGDVHFDDEEDYTVESPRGRNLLWVATHELGHSLGLEHSNVREAVMYPWYTAYKPGFKLNYDDIVGIQTLYGSRPEETTTTSTTTVLTTTSTTTATTSTPETVTKAVTAIPEKVTTTTKKTKITTGTPLPSNRLCPKGIILTVYYNVYADLNIMITNQNELYFLYKNGGIRYGPVGKRIFLPESRTPSESFTAAYITNKIDGRDYIILFAGPNYYIYQHFRFRSGPHSIHGNVKGDTNPLNLKFPTRVRQIDAAMTWHRNKRTYFFSGTDYWRYDNENKKFDAGYPKNTQMGWIGAPEKIDAVHSTDDGEKTFFISGNQYYLLEDNYAVVSPNYPEHIGKEWLNCGGRSSLNSTGSLVDPNFDRDERKGFEP